MGLELAKAFIVIRADMSKLTSDLGRAKTKVTGALGGVAATAGGVVAAAGIQRLGRAMMSAVDDAMSFEKTMIDVRSNARLLGDEGAAAFRMLEKTARKMGATTMFSANEAASALNQLVLGGLNATQAATSLKGVLDLAASANLELAEAAKIVVTNMVKYNIAANETGKIGDFLASAQSRASVTARSLDVGLTTLGASASSMGVEFRQVVAVLTGFGKAGVPMSVAGTSIKTALGRIAAQSPEVARVLDDMGVSIQDFVTDNGLDLISLFEDIADKFPTGVWESGAASVALFGAKGTQIVGVLQQMKGEGNFVRETYDQMGKDIGRSGVIAAAKMETFWGSVKKVRSALGELAIAGLTPVLDALKPILEIVVFLVGGLAKFARYLKAFTPLMSAVFSIMLLLVGAALAWALALKMVALTTVFITAMSGPAGWAALAVGLGLVTAAAIGLNAEMDDTKEKVEELLDKSKGTAVDRDDPNSVLKSSDKMIKETEHKIGELEQQINTMLDSGLGGPLVAGHIVILDAEIKALKGLKDSMKETAKAATTGKGPDAEDIVPDSEDATSAMADLDEEIYRIRNNLTDAQIDVRDFMQSFTPSDEQMRKFKLMRKELEKVKKATEAKTKFKEAGEAFAKSMQEEGERMRKAMRTPAESLRDEIARVQELLSASVISQETAGRKIEQLREKGMEDRAGGQRFGFREMGKHIQDMVSKKGHQLDQKRNQLLEKQIAVQQDIVKAVAGPGNRWEA